MCVKPDEESGFSCGLKKRLLNSKTLFVYSVHDAFSSSDRIPDALGVIEQSSDILIDGFSYATG